MRVHITFDVEVWCGGWNELDRRFPAAFERYCFGRSRHGDYALPKTIEILRRHGLTGVFFVEPLFSARFGAQWLQTITSMLQEGGQDVQLHLHPEWTDEISPAILDDVSRKRQHLTHYSVHEQTTLIQVGRNLLEAATRIPVKVFRAGSFAANADTYRALAANGLAMDSSLNPCYDYSAGSMGDLRQIEPGRECCGVSIFPVTALQDGLGRLRTAQLNGCSVAEFCAALLDAERQGVEHFVIVSHNFEMLRPGSCEPDWIVVRRFERLCRFLAEHSDRFDVARFEPPTPSVFKREPVRPRVGLWPTVHRYAEQAYRALG